MVVFSRKRPSPSHAQTPPTAPEVERPFCTGVLVERRGLVASPREHRTPSVRSPVQRGPTVGSSAGEVTAGATVNVGRSVSFHLKKAHSERSAGRSPAAAVVLHQRPILTAAAEGCQLLQEFNSLSGSSPQDM